jgi:hypothetical protein
VASRKKVKWGRVILITLAIIGTLTVIDNGYRLVKEVGSSVVHAVQNHRWNMVVVK